MPIISQFYGILVIMHYKENERHNLPHIHVEYGDYDAVFDLQGNKIAGKFPLKQRKMVEAWILIHEDELKALWKLVENKEEIFKIDPLK